MKPERFVEYIQNCFNDRFHPDMKATMLAYLEPFDELFISILARVALLRHPRQYRTAPGIAELEKYKDEAYTLYQSALQDLRAPEITDTAGNEVDQSKVAESLESWMKERSRQ